MNNDPIRVDIPRVACPVCEFLYLPGYHTHDKDECLRVLLASIRDAIWIIARSHQ